MTTDFSCEAIPERDPAYEIPPDDEGTDEGEKTMTLAEAHHWEEMVAKRPMLRCLRP